MKYILIGCGRMGAELERILAQRGHGVTVVDENRAAFEKLSLSFHGQVVVGSGFDREVLLRSGIEAADGLAAVTNNDETNVVIARLARHAFGVPRVVARLFDPRKAELYRRLGIQIVAPISWATHRLAELLSYSELDTILSLGSGEVEIVEVEVPPLLAGQKVRDVSRPGEVHIVAVRREGKAFIPSMETVFRKDDFLCVAVLSTSVERLRRMLTLS